MSNYDISTVLDSLSCGIAIMDSDLHVQFVNQSMNNIWEEDLSPKSLKTVL